ncbi:hypothetical protein CANINC_003936 [Pichia inconspicua]|uniref:Tag1-like fifth Ig-like domain-containing protein n=1 Tax=Pichia inconspicua TaxID=52247 RepID=A0A4T0WXH8_9ASCO|nr:hypothetical protein CANINC_003936 [[Candida] inconspicua]
MDHNCHFGVKVPDGYRDDWVGETDQSRLLEVDPTPLTDDDVPPWLQDTENVIIDQAPQPFYYKHRKLLLILNVAILIILLLAFIAHKTVNSVVENLSVTLTDINNIRLTDTGIWIGDINAEVNFEQSGYIDWTSKLNNTQFVIDGPINVSTNETRLVSVEFLPKTFKLQIIDGIWKVNLKDIQFKNNGEQLRQFINQKENTATIDTNIIIWDKTIPLKKDISLSQKSMQGLLSYILEYLLDETIITGINDFSYDENVGVSFTTNMKVPVISDRINGSVILGFTLNEVFHEFMEIEFSINHKNAELNVTIFNIDKTLIEEEVIQELVNQLFNGDEEVQPMNFTVITTHLDSGPTWLSELWKNLIIDVALKLSKLKYDRELSDFPIIPMELENLNVSPENGRILIQNRLYALLNNLFKKYNVSMDGQISYAGLELQLSQSVSKVESGPLSIVEGDIFFDVNDPELGRKAVDDLLQGRNDVQNMTLNLNSNITSTFYNGKLEIKKTLLFDIGVLNRILNDSRTGHDSVELVDMKILERSYIESEAVRFFVKLLIKLPFFFENFSSDFENIALGVEFNDSYVAKLSVVPGFGNDAYVPIDLVVTTDIDDLKVLSHLETLVSRFISGIPVNLTISCATTDDKTLPECNQNINGLLTDLKVPVNISTDNLNGSPDGGSYFIKDTTMHVVSQEVEMVLFNPISNSEIIVEILEGQALREGYIIGYLKEPVKWIVEPGIWHSPRAKVQLANTGSIGWGMIEDAIRGDGVLKDLTVKGIIRVSFKQYPDFGGFTITFLSSGHKSGKVRWLS